MTYKLSMEMLLQKQALLNNVKFGKRNNFVHDLQTILFEMGFAKELNWKKFGADGDYGKSTLNAVKLFAEKNNVTTQGKTISLNLAKTILKRYNVLDDLQHLADAVQENKLKKFYSQESNEETGNAVLKTLLKALGYITAASDTGTTENNFSKQLVTALIAFGEKEDIPTDGKSLNKKLAQRILDRLSVFYGESLLVLKTKKIISTSLLVQTIIENVKIRVNVSNGDQQKKFTRLKKGLYTFGNQRLDKYLKSKGDTLSQHGVTESSLNVMRAVAENEGNLDAINTWDNSFLSFGIFQWTLGPKGDKGELPALLKKIKIDTPDTFFNYFGQYGLDIARGTNAEIGYISFNGKDAKSSGLKELFRSPDWAFRFWQAGQDQAIMAAQVKHALARLKTFYWKRNVAGKSLSELITSEYGVALLLDNHVNRPGYVAKCVRNALRNTGLGDVSSWSTTEEKLLIDEYLSVRATFGKSPMTDAVKRANVTKKYLTKGLISGERESFVFGKV